MKIFHLYTYSIVCQKNLYRVLSDVLSVPNVSYSVYRRRGGESIFFKVIYKIIKGNNLRDE